MKEVLYLADWVGVLAADPFLPSKDARCCSRASSKLLGACKREINRIYCEEIEHKFINWSFTFVRSGISPLSMPTFCKNN